MNDLTGIIKKPDDVYTVCCIQCHTIESLQMVAHRAPAGLLVGWVFVCPECVGDIYGCNITLITSDEEIAP